MKTLLIKGDAWEYVNGTKKRPEGNEAKNIEVAQAWDTVDAKAKSDLILAISSSELKQIKNRC